MSKLFVKVRDVKIGAGAPISIQSMTNVNPNDEEAILSQIRSLENAGCDIVRMTIPDKEAADVLARVRKKTDMPIVADIHFNYKMALLAIDAGADKIRINPGNIGSQERLERVVKEAGAAGIPIRVGVNSGSLEKTIIDKYGGVTPEGLCESALNNLKKIEDMGFSDLVLSMKASDVRLTYEAHRLISNQTDHPLHIGVTEAGTPKKGKIKSAVGIGSLLLAGIGDTIRVSLTANPVEEVIFAKQLLETIGLRSAKYDIVSCPTCGRTKVDIENLAMKVEAEVESMELKRPVKVAVMGCVVNGPGEAREADYGVAGGAGKGVIFAGSEIIKTVDEEDIVAELMKVIIEREGL